MIGLLQDVWGVCWRGSNIWNDWGHVCRSSVHRSGVCVGMTSSWHQADRTLLYGRAVWLLAAFRATIPKTVPREKWKVPFFFFFRTGAFLGTRPKSQHSFISAVFYLLVVTYCVVVRAHLHSRRGVITRPADGVVSNNLWPSTYHNLPTGHTFTLSLPHPMTDTSRPFQKSDPSRHYVEARNLESHLKQPR